jgi:hypothetical protein
MGGMMNGLQTFFPLVIDSTILAEFNSCFMSGFRRYIQHLNGEESTDLVAGKAFAKGLEVARKSYYDLGWDGYAAIEAGKEACFEEYGDHAPFPGTTKTCDRMVSTVEMYFMEYPFETDVIQPVKLENGKYAIEYSFAHQLPIMHPDLNIPLIFCGRADMLPEYAGKLWVSDEKTTSQITEKWADQWQTRGQFTAYTWGLRKDGINVAGAFIRGIALYKQQTKFVECTTTRSDFEVRTWEQQMLEMVHQMVNRYKRFKEVQQPDYSAEERHPSRFFPGSWNESCFKYFRPCSFQQSCKTDKSEGLLYMQNEQNIWLPHRHVRMPLEQFLQELRDSGIEV